MPTFTERLLIHLRYLAIKPVMIFIAGQTCVFIIMMLFPHVLAYATCNSSVFTGEVWRLCTAIFSHASFNHFFFNILLLFLLGRWFYETLGTRRCLIILLSAGAISNGIHIMLYPSAILGISGGLYALLAASCAKDPHARMLFFPAWIFCSVIVFLQFVGFLNSLHGSTLDNTAYDAHLFGALFGYAYMTITVPVRSFLHTIKHKKRARQEQAHGTDYQRFDDLLQKVSDHGLHSLSDQERIFLKKYSDYERQREEDTSL